MILTAPGIVIVNSTIGRPLLHTASAANNASLSEYTRTAGMMPISVMRARISSFVIESFGGLETKDGGSRQAPATHGFPKLLHCSQVSSDGLAPGELRSAIASFGVQEVEQARSAASIGVFTNVTALPRHL